LAACWYWPLIISRSTQPTDAPCDRDDDVARRQLRGIGRGHLDQRGVLGERVERTVAELGDDDLATGGQQ